MVFYWKNSFAFFWDKIAKLSHSVVDGQRNCSALFEKLSVFPLCTQLQASLQQKCCRPRRLGRRDVLDTLHLLHKDCSWVLVSLQLKIPPKVKVCQWHSKQAIRVFSIPPAFRLRISLASEAKRKSMTERRNFKFSTSVCWLPQSIAWPQHSGISRRVLVVRES